MWRLNGKDLMWIEVFFLLFFSAFVGLALLCARQCAGDGPSVSATAVAKRSRGKKGIKRETHRRQ